MEIMELYPLIKAEPLASGNKRDNPLSYFLFSTQTNRGYAVDGLAALFCKGLNGKKRLKDLITDFEKEYGLESGKFDKEIKILIKDLGDNSLLVFNEAPLEE